MKLLADENFPPTLVSYLQRKRHNIKRIQRTARGAVDVTVSERAQKENRIVITFDKDFLKKEVEVKGVMIFDFPKMKPEEIIPYMDEAIDEISHLNRKKKPFVAIYSKKGVQLKEEI